MRRVVITLTNIWIESQTARDPTDPPGKTSLPMVRARGLKRGDLSIHPDWPRESSRINDNYCVNVLKTGLLAGSQEIVNYVQLPGTLSVKTMNSQTSVVNCSVVNPVLFAEGHSQRKDIRPGRYCKLSQSRIKMCGRCFLCRSIVFCQACNQCPSSCKRPGYL